MVALISLTVAVPVTNNAPGKMMLNITVANIGYLSRYGYYQAPDPRVGRIASEEDLSMSIKKLQRFANIPETGVMDEQTREFMNSPRCGMPDLGPSDNAKRKRRFSLHGTTWKKQKLSWQLADDSNNSGLTRKQVRDTLRLAFSKWQAVTNLDFYEKDSGEADIMVSFERSSHRDGNPFDGRGGDLAHAFYPHNNAGLSGDVHYDNDEYFTLGSKRGYDFLWVTVHELGHSLGLTHSNVKEAIMYPKVSKGSKGNVDLTYDDIVGIQHIYGSRVGPTPATKNPPTPTTKTIITSKMCPGNYHAIFYDKSSRETYVVNDDKVYILGKNLGVRKGPLELDSLFPGLDRADAVYVNREDNIVFFKGARYYVYKSVLSAQLLEEGSIYDKFKGLSREVTKVDAAFIWKRNGRMYIFADDDYYRYDELKRRIDYGYPRKIKNAWHGVPDNVDAVFIWRNDKTYFFKGSQFYRMDDTTLTVQAGYPRDTAKSWSRCVGGLSDSSPANSIEASYITLLTLLASVVARMLL